jgi:hypothetical protein
MLPKFITVVFFLCNGFVSNCQTLDCYKFKDGKFKINDTNLSGDYVIVRTGKYQVENIQNLKLTLKFKVAWLNECTYALKLDTVLRNENNLPFPKDMIVRVKIIETTKNSYFQETTNNLNNTVNKSEVIKIQ